MNRGFLSKWDQAEAPGWARPRTFRNERLISYGAVGVVLISIAGFVFEAVAGFTEHASRAEWGWMIQAVTGKSLIGFVLFSGLVFQLTRLGYLVRFSRRHAVSDSEPEQVYTGEAPSLTILVPSYKEEPDVVRQTLVAAALQQFPNRRIALLIDDPPTPADAEDAARLIRTRNLPHEINALFSVPARGLEQALAEVLQRRRDGSLQPEEEVQRLAALLHDAAEWLERMAADTPVKDHTDALFVERILRSPARSHRARALVLTAAPDPARLDLSLEYRRLAALFKVEVTSFERKRYANLSHEPNKAMNLNSYLALMGKSFREVASPSGLELAQTDDAEAALRIPNADFIVVLDADSLILPDYSLRLVAFMGQPGNDRVAVVQTPYAAVPDAASAIERIAGATTDVQLMSHQGSTQFGASSWVGASALVRRAALDDIVVVEEERGYPIPSYIRDRTLNEDTDTTVDLIRNNWTVYNYPDRLAYSATPPDFGSLLIQRRRWATGGLIILPNLLRYFLGRPSVRRLWESLVRAQYILSAPVGSLGMAILVLFPFQPGTCWSFWVLPAFFAWLVIFGRDLMHNGHRPPDLFRALALNVMLLPINLAGAVNSIRQLRSRRKIPFQRTPKIQGRTSAPAGHIAAQFAQPLIAATQCAVQAVAHDWLGCLFMFLYAAACGYSLHVFIGWQAVGEDLRVSLEPRLRPRLQPLFDRVPVNKWRLINEK